MDRERKQVRETETLIALNEMLPENMRCENAIARDKALLKQLKEPKPKLRLVRP
jgi:hypothetical protein